MTEISVPLTKRVGEMTCPSFEHKKIGIVFSSHQSHVHKSVLGSMN